MERERDNIDLSVRITRAQYATLANVARQHGTSPRALIRTIINNISVIADFTDKENVVNETEEIQSRS